MRELCRSTSTDRRIPKVLSRRELRRDCRKSRMRAGSGGMRGGYRSVVRRQILKPGNNGFRLRSLIFAELRRTSRFAVPAVIAVYAFASARVMAARIAGGSATSTGTRTIRFDRVLRITCHPFAASATDTTSAGRSNSVMTVRTRRSIDC